MPKATTDILLTLCAFSAGGLDVLGDELPSRLVICPWGSRDIGARGKVIVNQKTVAAFAASQKLLGRDGKVAGDFDHNTVEGHPAYLADKEPRHVAAWGIAQVEPGIGITVTGLTYTPEGEAALKGGHFQDISPAVVRDEQGVVIGLHSWAFCRHGQIEGFTIEQAAATGRLKAQLSALSASLPESESAPMKPTPELIALFAALGMSLAPEADEAAVATALKDATTKIEEAKKKPEAMSAEVQSIKGEITALTTEVKTLQGERDELKRAELLRQAAAEGKVIPLSAETLKVTPLSVLADIVKTAKAGEVPITKKTPDGETGRGKVETFSAESIERIAALGVTPEDVAKYAPHLSPDVKTA
ncbi:MAG: phage protease [Prosthecobacter sp.]|nr:phage protease [Prosthecobacter sp.]